MCTIVVARDAFGGQPLLIWANRDEMQDRPSVGPAVREGVLAPRDLVAGGTWLGVNRHGLFVGITNRFAGGVDRTRRSRGELVIAALQHGSAARAADAILGRAAADYNGFHLVMADTSSLHVVWSDGAALHHVKPDERVFFVTERSFGAAATQREVWLADALAGLESPSDDALFRMLGHHAEPTFDGMCVHWDQQNYGTRSGAVIRLGSEPGYLWTDGPPCTSVVHDCSEQLAALLSAQGDA